MLKPDAVADAIVLAMKGALAPVLGRMQGAEIRQMEYAQTVEALGSRVDSLERERAEWRERVAMLEVKALQPGPPGPPGKDGLDGKDGAPGLRYCGVFVDGTAYERGDVVTWAGSAWHCHAPTTTIKPGDSATAWQLVVKRGRDGRDGRP